MQAAAQALARNLKRKRLERAISLVEGSALHVIGLLRGSDRRVDPVPIERLKAVLKILRARYDFIVCDAPPVLLPSGLPVCSPDAKGASAAATSPGV